MTVSCLLLAFLLSWLSWASNSCQQGGLLTCLQHSLHADTLFLELSSNSAWYSSPWQGVSLLLSSSLCNFRTIKPWTWFGSRDTTRTHSTSSSPHQVQFSYPAVWFIAPFLPSTHPSISHHAFTTFFNQGSHIVHACLCTVQKGAKFAPFIPSCFVYT